MFNLLKKKIFFNKNYCYSEIFLSKKNKKKIKFKHFPSSNQEWFNSIYLYNNNNIKSLPVRDKIVNKLIKAYYDMNIYLKKRKKSSGITIRFKRLSTNRIFVSKALIKHTNNKIIITIFTYNRQLKSIQYKLKKIYKKLTKIIYRSYIYKIKYKTIVNKYLLYKKENNILVTYYNILPQILLYINNTKYALEKKKYFIKINKKKINYLTVTKKKILIYLKKLKKLKLNIYKIKMLYLNNCKFNDKFLFGLKDSIKKYYNTKIEFRIVNLKKLQLNSDIFSESIAVKLKNRKNRLLKVFKRALSLVKIPYINKYNFNRLKIKNRFFKYLNINDKFYIHSITHKDILHEFLYKLLWYKNNSNYSKINVKNVEKTIFKSLKHKKVKGIRLEGAGRLTKRLIASRSIFKYKYKGNIKNIDSSNKKISTVILKGHLKSNIQYTLVNSRTRNGSFGLKGWISSY
jgi:hypothetical protein